MEVQRTSQRRHNLMGEADQRERRQSRLQEAGKKRFSLSLIIILEMLNIDETRCYTPLSWQQQHVFVS